MTQADSQTLGMTGTDTRQSDTRNDSSRQSVRRRSRQADIRDDRNRQSDTRNDSSRQSVRRRNRQADRIAVHVLEDMSSLQL